MRIFLLVLLAALAGVLLWAIRLNSYTDSLVFVLSLISTGLCGYLITDFFYYNERKTFDDKVQELKRDITALKEDNVNLEHQLAMATPETAHRNLQITLADSEAERTKLAADLEAHMKLLAAANGRIETLQKQILQIDENATSDIEVEKRERDSLQDALRAAKDKLNNLANENAVLKIQLELIKKENAPQNNIATENSLELIENNAAEEAFLAAEYDDMEENEEDEAEAAPTQEMLPTFGMPEDLKEIEGIGPKIEGILKEAGIKDWHDLAKTSLDELKSVLAAHNGRFRYNDPSTWAQQAKLLSEGKFEDLRLLRQKLVGGKMEG